MCHCICTAFSRLHYFSHPCLWFRHCCVHVCFLFLIICFISFHHCAIDCILLFFMFHHLSHQFSSVCNCFIIVFIIFIDFSHHLSPFRHCFHVLFIMCHHFYHHVSWFCHCSVQFLSYFIMSLIGFHQFVIVNKCGCFVSSSCFSICCIMVSLFLIQFLYVLIMVRHSSYQCSSFCHCLFCFGLSLSIVLIEFHSTAIFYIIGHNCNVCVSFSFQCQCSSFCNCFKLVLLIFLFSSSFIIVSMCLFHFSIVFYLFFSFTVVFICCQTWTDKNIPACLSSSSIFWHPVPIWKTPT